MLRIHPTIGLAASLIAALFTCTSVSAETAEQFYKGKTVTIQIGYAPGGGYDVYARQLARFYGRHLPGQPTVTTQNVPGAGSLKLANAIYSVAPRDGTVIGSIGREQITAPLFGVPGANFDATKVNWVGNMDRAASLSVVWATSPIQTIADARKQEVTVGGTGPASTTVVLPTAFNKLMGYKFKVIAGYPGGGDITLALERGEVEGRFSWSYASLMSTRPDWVRDKKIRFLAASAFKRLPEAPDVPTVIELADTEQHKQVISLILAGDVLARPFMAPPSLPPERLAALRDAFSATMRDPEFLAEAKQQKLELDPMDWQEMTETINKIYATPAPVVKAAMAIIQDAAH
jgi:tripartite-type tricarboxylate transporter receptor subunit TctC